jgi:SNF2 family DNA or RNA helicase
MRQAARRAWRIGQPNDFRLYYLYDKATMQHKAMTLMLNDDGGGAGP